MSLYIQPSGRRLLHLVNYDERHPVSNIEVVLQQPSDQRVAAVTLLSPDSGNAHPISATQSGHELRFMLARLEVYSLVVID
jgi:hypothetical protein